MKRYETFLQIPQSPYETFLTKVAIPNPKKIKIEYKTVDHVFIGYAYNLYQFFVHKSSIKDIYLNTIMESRNAIFFEDVFLWNKVQENHSL